MVKSAIVGRIIQLAQRLGANPSKFAGTRSNITFLGSGPSNELFSQSLRINELPGLFVAGTGKLKPQILSKVESGAAFAMANKLSTPQLKTLESGLKAMDNLRLGLVKPRGIINTESFRELGRRGAKGSEFREMGIALKAQKAKGFKEAMEAADDLIIEGSGGLITRSQLKNLSPEALKNLRLEYAPDIMARLEMIEQSEKKGKLKKYDPFDKTTYPSDTEQRRILLNETEKEAAVEILELDDKETN